MSALGALPPDVRDIRPLDRSIPYVDERAGRPPRKGRAFPDPHGDDETDEPRKPRSPALPGADTDDESEPAPVRPRVDVHVHH